MNPISWGILGTGIIANKFAAGIATVQDALIVAVGSRTIASAEQFAAQWHIAHAYASYEDLVSDPRIDVVYIATPHMLHFENVQLCLSAGKHVLCEKPFTVNAVQATQLFALAREKNLFLMEALWSRFIPGLCHVLQMVEHGVIGRVRQIHADFGFFSATGTDGRHYNPALAGGALLDVGIYPLSFAFWLLGSNPDQISAYAHMSATGVDSQNAILLHYPDGEMAMLASSIENRLSNHALILGDKGKILLDRFWCVEHIVWEVYNGSVYSHYLPVMQNGYEYEIIEVCRCIRAGVIQSPMHRWEDTLQLLQAMDSIRETWKFRYPFE